MHELLLKWTTTFLQTHMQSQDEETTYRERILKRALVGLVLLNAVYIPVSLVAVSVEGGNYRNSLIWVCSFLVLALIYHSVRRGHFTLGAVALIITALTFTAYAVYVFGPWDVSIFLFASAVSLTGALLGIRAAIAVVAASTAIYGAASYMILSGIHPGTTYSPFASDVSGVLATLVVLVIIEGLFRSERERMIRQYKQQSEDLQQTNLQLEGANRAIAQQEAIKREMILARDIQASLLPLSDPAIRGLDIKSRSVPAKQVGGDFYEYFSLQDDTIGIAVGDVSGKGMPGALYMAIATTLIEGQATGKKHVAELMHTANLLLHPRMSKVGMNTALVYAMISPRDRMMSVSNAGLISPILYRNGECMYIQAHGLPLGAVEEASYEERSIGLQPGDVVIIASDGIVEAMNEKREMFGFARVEQAIRSSGDGSAQEMLDRLFSQVYGFIRETPPHDDMTAVVIRYVGEEGADHV